MAQIFFVMIAFCAILMGSCMSYGEESNYSNNNHDDNGVIHVSGKVLCQDCTQGWKEWVHDAKPIKGVIVSITCMDDQKKVVHYGGEECDETGSYELTVKKYINGKKLDHEKCSVKLVYSPNPVCNIATDFNGGRSGVYLNKAKVVYGEIKKYVHEPFYYTTPMCDDPENDDNEHSNGKENNY